MCADMCVFIVEAHYEGVEHLEQITQYIYIDQ